MAPRRLPADMMVRHMASHTSMKLTGPEASAPIEATRAPCGRSVEKSCPMPPPCCIVSAASLTPSKMAPRSSAMVPSTKQLKSVTERPVPAPARMRPAGRKPKSAIASWKRCAHFSRAALAALLRRGGGAGDAPEGVVERGVDGGAFKRLEAILEVPDLLRDRGQEFGCSGGMAASCSRATKYGLAGSKKSINVPLYSLLFSMTSGTARKTKRTLIRGERSASHRLPPGPRGEGASSVRETEGRLSHI